MKSFSLLVQNSSGSIKNASHNVNPKYSISALYDPVVLTALWPLKSCKRVGVFIGGNAEFGEIYESDLHVSRISTI